MKENSALRTLRFIFITVVLFVLTFSAVVVTVLNLYIPKYLAKVEGKEVGYFTSPTEFDEVYEKLVSEKEADGLKVEVYLNEEPEFNLSYVRESVVEEQNLYTNLRAFVIADYTVYNVKVNNSVEMTFATQKEADDYAAKIKKNIKTTIAVNVEEEVTQELVKTTEKASAQTIYTDLVSRYKPYVRQTSSATYASLGATTYASGKPAKELFNFIAGGRRPTSGVVTQSFKMGTHSGIDIASNACPSIYPYKSGVVTKVVTNPYTSTYGCYVVVSHGTDGNGNRLDTLYAHLKSGSINVSVGDSVTQSTVIGTMGSTGRSTGIHLHFEIRVYNGTTKYYNPVYFI